MTKADQIELALRRAELIRKDAPSLKMIAGDCKTISRNATKLRRLNEEACNGVQRYNPSTRRFEADWSEIDQDRFERETLKAQDAIREALSYLVTRGFEVKFYSDPRAGCAFRVSNAANTRDCFV